MVNMVDPLTATLGNLDSFNNIKYGVYRAAMKLQYIQKKTKLCHVNISMWREVIEQHCLMAPGIVLEPAETSAVVNTLLNTVSQNLGQDKFNSDQVARLLLAWLSVLYPQQVISSLQLNVAMCLMCGSDSHSKHRMLYEMACGAGHDLTLSDLSHLLHLSSYLLQCCGEQAVLGDMTSLNAAQDCFTHNSASFHRTISYKQYESWVMTEPPYLAWIPTLQRLTASQSMKHEAKCCVCKCYPIFGLRYRCLKCVNFDICQACFLTAKTVKNHKESHPLKEYIREGTTSESVKDLTLMVKNYLTPKKKRPLYSKSGFRSSMSHENKTYDSWQSIQERSPKGQLSYLPPPKDIYSSCPAILNQPDSPGPLFNERMSELENQNLELAHQVQRLHDKVSMSNGPPPYGSSYSERCASSAIQDTSEVVPDRFIDMANMFSASIEAYTGSAKNAQPPVLSTASNVCYAMDLLVTDITADKPPAKPKRSSPSRSFTLSRSTPSPYPDDSHHYAPSHHSTPQRNQVPRAKLTHLPLKSYTTKASNAGNTSVDLELSFDLANSQQPCLNSHTHPIETSPLYEHIASPTLSPSCSSSSSPSSHVRPIVVSSFCRSTTPPTKERKRYQPKSLPPNQGLYTQPVIDLSHPPLLLSYHTSSEVSLQSAVKTSEVSLVRNYRAAISSSCEDSAFDSTYASMRRSRLSFDTFAV